MANEVEETRERLTHWGGSGVAKIERIFTLEPWNRYCIISRLPSVIPLDLSVKFAT